MKTAEITAWLHRSVKASELGIAPTGALLFVIKILGCGLGLLMQLLLARLLGFEAFGIFITAFNAAIVLAIFASGGIAGATARFLPRYLALGQDALARGFLKGANVITVSGGALGALALLCVSAWLANKGDLELAKAAAVATPLVVVLAASQTAAALLQALERPLQSDVPALFVRPVLVIAAALTLAHPAISWLDGTSAMLVMLLASTIALLLASWWVANAVRSLGLPRTGVMNLRTWLTSGFVMILIISGAALQERLDTMFIAGLTNTADAGIYSVAARFAQIISLAPAGVAARAAPLLAQNWSRGDREAFVRVATASLYTSVGLAFGFGLLLSAAGGLLLKAFGAPFEAGLPALQLLVVAHVVLAVAGGIAPMLVASGREGKAAALLGLSVCLNAVLNLVLIPRLGMLGAAIATTLAMSAESFTFAELARRDLGVNVWAHPTRRQRCE